MLALVALLACGSPCGESFEVLATETLDGDESITDQECYVTTTDAQGVSHTDLSACCPDGYEAVGFSREGNVVCVGKCP